MSGEISGETLKLRDSKRYEWGCSEKTPVFAETNGNPYHLHGVSDGVKRLMNRIGLVKEPTSKVSGILLPPSALSVDLLAMEIVRDLMEHSSIMTTATHYTHVRPQVRDTAMSVF